ncbi:MAG: hypothetical protein KF762_09690 [Acidobacteria bacterium]|nr:hypothetical protein [Acidobacteriota bacterium]
MRTELEKLIELQITDTTIRNLRNILGNAETRRAELEQEFEQHAFSIRERQNVLAGLKTEQATLEKKIAENRIYLERADRNLKHAQNQKEYETAMREIDSLQKQITTFETEILGKQGAIEEVEKELSERADEINTLDSKRDEALAAFDREIEKARTELAEAEAKRGGVFDTLPANLAAVYSRLVQRSRDGIAVAEVVNGSCTACFISLRPQVQVEVRRMESIITCESCTRILYVVKKEAEATAS